MTRKTIFDLYNEQHANEKPNVEVGTQKEVVSTPTEEVETKSNETSTPEVRNVELTTPSEDKGATSLANENERGNNND